jgi:Uma2 family endonuclease
MPAAPAKAAVIDYPETDGQPMSDNTRQFRWIMTLAGNLAALFRDRDDVFVSGNQFWYPVEGEPEIKASPDVYAVFGRPKGDRLSYKQWEEGNVPMTVVMDVLSPKNTVMEMADKQAFYEDYGVEEYYIYDPDSNRLQGFLRQGGMLVRVRGTDRFVSPRLGIKFDLSGPEMVVRYPDGRPFLTFVEMDAERAAAAQRVVLAEQRANRLAELTRKVLQQQATAEELRELQEIIQHSPPPAP